MSQTMAPAQSNRSPRRIRRSIASAVAAVLALSSLAFIATPASAAPNDPPTVVSLTFDDGNSDQLAAAALMKAKGMPGTFYVNSGSIGMSGFMTRDQLTALAADGHEIAGHTLNHTDLTTLPTEEARRQICLDRANLHGWGLQPRSFAYPFAVLTPTIRGLVAGCGYNSARGLGDIESRFGCPGCPRAEAVPPSSPYETKALDQVDSTWTLQDFKDAVTRAEQAGGGWVQLTFHNFCGTGCGNLSVSEAIFTEFLNWLALRKASNNTSVKTVGEVVGGTVKAPVQTPDPIPTTDPSGLPNPGFESVNASGAPMCWQEATSGGKTATYSTVSPGRTGNRAGQVTVSDYVEGDAKLITSLDLGTCAPAVTTGKSYVLKSWYTSTASTQYAVYLRNSAGGWEYWTSSPYFAAASTYTEATWTTQTIPAGYTAISFGLNLFSNGTLTSDDYSIAAVYVPPATPVTSATVSPTVPDGTAGWYRTKPTVTLAVTSGNTAETVRQYSFDGTTWLTYTAPFQVPDGTSTVSYRSRTGDVVEATRTLVLKVDSTSPTVTPTFDRATRTVDATATDATSGPGAIQYREGTGAWGAFTGPAPTSPAAKTLEFRVTDTAGNVSPVATLNVPAALVTTATVAPAAPAATGWYTTRPKVTLTNNSATATRQYSIDGGAWVQYSSPIDIPEGTKTLSYRSVEAPETEATRTLALKVDTVVPEVIPAFDKTARKVSATAQDPSPGSGGTRIEWRVVGGDWATYSAAWVPSDAATSLEFRAHDTAGNVSAIKKLSVPERHAASTVGLSISPTSTTYGKRVTATINVGVPAGEPAASGRVTVLADGRPVAIGSVANGRGTVSIPGLLGVGTRTITAAYAGDATTKPSTSAPVSLRITKAAPRVSFRLSPTKATAGRTRVKVKTVVSVPGTSVRAAGRVHVLVNGVVVRRATLSASRNGKLTITLPKFKNRMSGKKVRVSVKFAGSSSLTAATSSKRTLRIR